MYNRSSGLLPLDAKVSKMSLSNEFRCAPWRRYLVPIATFLVLLSLPLLPGGRAIGDESQMSRREKTIKSIEILGKVYDAIIANYVDELDPQKVAEAGIKGMLSQLDEHSQYLPPLSYEDLMMSTEGEFGGLGITIVIRDHYPTVVSPIEGTPAFFMGIQGGDQIVEIEGKATYDFKSSEAVKLLRGDPGTRVSLKIKREGVAEPIPLTITRAVIKVESVPYAFMIGDVGYIRVQSFARTTAEELETKLDELQKQGARGYILDLRWNPGGLLTAATEVSQLFLPKGKLVVFTKGRLQSQNASYYSEPRVPVHDKLPIIVLVNGSSASASEIVAAALQDHDAALVVGKTTFGKGSVQTVFRLQTADQEGAALKLTTAKYFTPSGRSIHKDRHRDDSDLDLTESDSTQAPPRSAPLEPADKEVPRSEKEQFKTDMGRTVYGGGGITPDIEIDQPLLNEYEIALERDMVMFSYANHYAATHQIARDFKVDDAVLSDFRTFLDTREKFPDYLKEYKLSNPDSLFAANREYIERGIRREVMRRGFGAQEAYKVASEDDPQLQHALDLFKKARTLPALLKLAADWNAEQLRQAKVEEKTPKKGEPVETRQ